MGYKADAEHLPDGDDPDLLARLSLGYGPDSRPPPRRPVEEVLS